MPLPSDTDIQETPPEQLDKTIITEEISDDDWEFVRLRLMEFYISIRSQSYSRSDFSLSLDSSASEERLLLSSTPSSTCSATASPLSFFARLKKDKGIEDQAHFRGSTNLSCYFVSEQRKACKVQNNPTGWIFKKNTETVKEGRYMYAISQKGSLYISSDALFHSQIKAGKALCSAGWLEYKIDASGNVNLFMDNSSGHYEPTIRQFLCGLEAAYTKGILPNQFHIEVNIYSSSDDLEDSDAFWREVCTQANHRSRLNPAQKNSNPIQLCFFEDTLVCCDQQGNEVVIERDSLRYNQLERDSLDQSLCW